MHVNFSSCYPGNFTYSYELACIHTQITTRYRAIHFVIQDSSLQSTDYVGRTITTVHSTGLGHCISSMPLIVNTHYMEITEQHWSICSIVSDDHAKSASIYGAIYSSARTNA